MNNVFVIIFYYIIHDGKIFIYIDHLFIFTIIYPFCFYIPFSFFFFITNNVPSIGCFKRIVQGYRKCHSISADSRSILIHPLVRILWISPKRYELCK